MKGERVEEALSDSLHVASMVVWCSGEMRAFERTMGQFNWAELPFTAERGRTVVVLEAADERALFQRIEQLKQLPGVLDAQLVYHHADEPKPLPNTS